MARPQPGRRSQRVLATGIMARTPEAQVESRRRRGIRDAHRRWQYRLRLHSPRRQGGDHRTRRGNRHKRSGARIIRFRTRRTKEPLTTATVPRRHRSSTTGSCTRLGSAGRFRPSMRSAEHSSGRSLHHRYNRTLGTASSPIADRDLVIVQADGDSALTAFAASTGDIKWTVKNDFTFASPIIVDVNGTRQVIAVTQQSIVGISVADGAVLWEHPWTSPYVQAITPVLYRDTIIVSGHNRGVMALKPIRREDRWGVDVVWETQEVSMFLSNPVVIGDTLFGLSHRNSGQFFAIDASTGQVLWRRQAAAGNEHGSRQGGRSSIPLERRCRVDRRQEQPDRFRAHQTLQRRRQRDVGPAGDIGKADLHQGSCHRLRCGAWTELMSPNQQRRTHSAVAAASCSLCMSPSVCMAT